MDFRFRLIESPYLAINTPKGISTHLYCTLFRKIRQNTITLFSNRLILTTIQKKILLNCREDQIIPILLCKSIYAYICAYSTVIYVLRRKYAQFVATGQELVLF